MKDKNYRKIGKYWYVEFYRKVDGKLQQVRLSTKKKTKKAAQKVNPEDAKDCTFDKLLEKYKETFQLKKSFRHKLYHFPLYERFRGRLLAEIQPDEIEKFKTDRLNAPVKMGTDKVKEGYRIREKHPKPREARKISTVNRELSTLRHMFSKAEEWNMINSSPFKKIKGLFENENNKRLRFLSEAEEERLLDKCAAFLRNIVLVALNTGMRKGEILSLKWEQIRDGFIYLTKTKTNIPRQIPLNDTMTSLFESLPRHITSDHVFYRQKDGTAYDNVYKSFNTAVREAGIEDFHFHDLRHTFASNLVKAGMSLVAVQQLLGHTDITMTMRYAHLANSYLKDAVRSLDRKKERLTGASDCGKENSRRIDGFGAVENVVSGAVSA